MAIATLSIDLVAKMAALEAGMTKAQQIVARSAADMEKNFAGLRNAAGSVFASFGGALAIGGLTAMFRATVDGIDKLNDLADVTGSTVEKISALEDVALRTGASIDVVGDALIKLNKDLTDPNPDSEASKALRQIGLDAAELRKQDPADALKKVADALAGYADDADKARLVQTLLGKSVREIGPYLKDLADAGQLNATVTTEQAKQAEAFNRQLQAMQANSVALARSIVGDMLPALTAFLERLRMLREGPGILAGIGEVFKGNIASTEQKTLDGYSAKIAEIDRQIGALKSDTRPLVQMSAPGEIQRLEAERAKLTKFADYYRSVVNQGSAGGGRGTGQIPPAAAKPKVGPAKMPATGGATEDKRRSFTDYQLELGQAIAKMVDDSDVARIQRLNDELVKLEELVAAGLDPAIASDVRAKLLAKLPKPLENASEAFRRGELEATNATNTDLASAALSRYNDQRERLNALLGATASAELEKQREDMLLLADALTRGAISEAQFTEAAQTRLGNLPKDLEKTNDIAKDLGMTFQSAFEDAIVGGKKFSDVLKGLEQDILRIVTRKLVTEPLGDALTSMLRSFMGSTGNAQGGGIFSSIFSSIAGSFGGFFAEGGNLGAGRWGVVGERGPELVRGGTSGATVVPLRAGGGHSVVINMTAQPGVSRQSAMQQGEAVGRQVRLALSRNG